MKTKGWLKGIVCLIVLYLYAGLVGGQLPFFLLYTGISVFLLALISTRHLTRVEVNTTLNTNRSEVGKTIYLTVEIENKSLIPIPWLRWTMELPEIFDTDRQRVYFTVLMAGQGKTVHNIPLKCHLRGFFQFGSLRLEAGDLFGFMRSQILVNNRLNLLVRPRADYLGKNVFCHNDAEGSGGFWFMKPGRRAAEFRGVRSYYPGDSLNKIHWKASLKAQKFLVKEFDQETHNQVRIFLDMSSSLHCGTGHDSSVERSVFVSASLAATAVQEGLGTGLIICSDDTEVTPLARSKENFGLLLDFLARAIPGKGVLAKTVLQEAMRQQTGNRVIIITPELSQELMESLIFIKSRGHKPLVCLIQPEAFGKVDLDLEARAGGSARLNQSGIPIIFIDKVTDLRLLFGGVRHEAC